jgi:hypothetical protein
MRDSPAPHSGDWHCNAQLSPKHAGHAYIDLVSQSHLECMKPKEVCAAFGMALAFESDGPIGPPLGRAVGSCQRERSIRQRKELFYASLLWIQESRSRAGRSQLQAVSRGWARTTIVATRCHIGRAGEDAAPSGSRSSKALGASKIVYRMVRNFAVSTMQVVAFVWVHLFFLRCCT